MRETRGGENVSEHDGPLQPLSTSQREALEDAVSSYESSMTPEAARYLVARGIGREEAKRFRLGVVADPHPGHGRHAGKLAIPYLDRAGRPLKVRFRCLQDHDHRTYFHGKYEDLKGEPPRTYNNRAIHEAGDEIHIAEGEFDALILNKIGLPAIAIPGAQAWLGRHRR